MSTIQNGTYAIDASHSNVEFAVKHMMITTVKGRFGDVKGTVTLQLAVDANGKVWAANVNTSTATRIDSTSLSGAVRVRPVIEVAPSALKR